jgi:hypothetical protein
MLFGLRRRAGGLASAALAKLPPGRAGLAVKVALGVVFIFWWTSGPGAEEAM